MTTTSIYTRFAAERFRGLAIGVISLSALLFMAMGVYRDLDLSFINALPTSFQSLVGLPPDADVAALAYGAMFNTYGALALGGIAISIGAAAIAGEERLGTMGELLSNPITRTRVLAEKSAALLTLIAIAGLLLWGAAEVAPEVLAVNTSGLYLGSFVVHVMVSTAFYGALAIAIGAGTGSYTKATTISAGLMVLSFIGVGLLPLINGVEDLVKVLPWYYLSNGDPLINGLQWDSIGILASASVIVLALGWRGFLRRDLRRRSTKVSLLDRLRNAPRTAAIANRFAGRTRVSHFWTKLLSEYQTLIAVIALAMLTVMGALLGPIYSALGDDVTGLADGFSDGLLALFGGGDLSTPEGFYQIETFGLMAPIAVMVVTILFGARGIAGEEDNKSIGSLLANPIRRSTLVRQQTIAMIIGAAAIGVAIFVGVSAGSWLGGLNISTVGIAAASLQVTLIGILYGAIALLLGAATGLTRVALSAAAGLALVGHFMNALGSLNDAAWQQLSPFYYYLESDPLTTGPDWGNVAVLATLSLIVVLAAFPAFLRRDLRR